MVATELTQVPSDEESTMVDVAKLSAPLATASEEDAASYTEIDEQRDALDTVESEEDVDASTLAALLQRYNQSMSVSMSMSMSGEEDAKLQNADSDVKETDDTEEDEDDDDIDEDGYAARAKDIMQRYKTEYALSEDSEQTSADSDEDGEEKEEDEEQHRDVDIDGVEKGDATFSECIEERAEELINKSRQMLDSSEMNVQEEEGKEDGDGIDAESVEEVDLLANVEIGEELLEGVGSEPAEDEVLEDVESELLEDVEIGEEAAADIECSASNATEVTEDLEEMMAQLMKENEELKKKKELQKRIDDLAKENKKLKESTNETPQRSALASVACKFDDAVTTAVTKVSKIMVCAPADEDIFDAEGGLVTMSDESFPSSGVPQDENGVCVVGSESEDGKNVSSTWVTDGAMDENLNLQRAARSNAYNMKMQAYNEKYHPHAPEESSPPMSDPVSLIDATLLEARIATGEATNATTADSLDEAMRRVEEAKQFIKNRSLLKTQTQANY